MASLGNFDATQVAPAGDRTAIPAGEYKASVINSEMKPTKDGKGQFLEIVLEIVDGQHKGRRLWDRLNLVNSNAQAVEIAKSTLSAICHATGIMQPKDSGQLHNIPMLVRVACRQYNGDTTNEVKGYKKLSTQANVTASSVATEKAPWE